MGRIGFNHCIETAVSPFPCSLHFSPSNIVYDFPIYFTHCLFSLECQLPEGSCLCQGTLSAKTGSGRGRGLMNLCWMKECCARVQSEVSCRQ